MEMIGSFITSFSTACCLKSRREELKEEKKKLQEEEKRREEVEFKRKKQEQKLKELEDKIGSSSSAVLKKDFESVC